MAQSTRDFITITARPRSGTDTAMRLLQVETKKLHDFTEANVPTYAILSHTWRDGEVLFPDIQYEFPEEKNYEKQGFKKIRRACQQALKEHVSYIWIDTCCTRSPTRAHGVSY